MQGVHDGPGDVSVSGSLGSRGAERNLAATSGAALDGQEGLRNVGPAGVPLDPAGSDHVLGLEHQSRFRLQAVVNPLRTWVEVADDVVHPDPHAGGIDADVLDVEAFGQLFDLSRLVGE